MLCRLHLIIYYYEIPSTFYPSSSLLPDHMWSFILEEGTSSSEEGENCIIASENENEARAEFCISM